MMFLLVGTANSSEGNEIENIGSEKANKSANRSHLNGSQDLERP